MPELLDAVDSEDVAGAVHVLGANIPLDGRVAWVPADLRGFQPNNCYLLLDDRGPLLIDTGLKVSREAIFRQLEALLPLGSDLYIFVTRPEMDSVANLAELTQRYRVVGNNTRDFFLAELETVPSAGGPLDTGRSNAPDLDGLVRECPAPLKAMLTKWFYHDDTRTLFTSDVFSHVTVATAGAGRIAPDTAPASPDEIRAMTYAKFWWLPRSRPGPHREPGPRRLRGVRRGDPRPVVRLRDPRARTGPPACRRLPGGPAVSVLPYKALPSPLPREFAPGIHWLGGCRELILRGEEVHQPNYCYLIIGPEKSLLVDTATETHWPALERQVLEALDGRTLDYVAPSHPEVGHAMNVGRILERFERCTVVGDVRDLHLHFPEWTDRLRPVPEGEPLHLGGDYDYVFTAAPIRDLPSTRWGYERGRQVLFVSDGFGYVHLPAGLDQEDVPIHLPGDCGLLSHELAQPTSVEMTEYVLRAALVWPRYVDCQSIIDEVEGLFARYPPRWIAPAHGNVISDPAVALKLMVDAFALIEPEGVH